MITPSQLAANQANAQLSTGPKSAAGKRKSSQNAISHGLSAASPEVLAKLGETQQAEFQKLRARLFAQTNPSGAAEEQVFEAYAWATFQAQRARRFLSQAELIFEAELYASAQLADTALRRLDTLARYCARHERSAARAFALLGQLQADRVAANEIHCLLRRNGMNEPISPALPVAKTLARGKKPNEFSYAQSFLFGSTLKDPDFYKKNPQIPNPLAG
jgi:hypothetical protein